MDSKAFDLAIARAMIWEVSPNFKLTPAVIAGKCDTPAAKKATGYVNDALDAGGETKFGVAKNANPSVNIKALTWDQAKEIYFKKYWLEGNCDKLSDRLAILHFDGCVNHGPKKAKIFLQRALGVAEDGALGPKTFAAISAAGELSLCNKICDVRAQFYRDIVKNKPEQVRFLNGWLNRINSTRTYILADQLV